jgi:hypothetical protein
MTQCNMIYILVMLCLESDEERQFREETAITKGLGKTASWNEIIDFNAEQERKELTKKLDLSINATWSEIVEANEENILVTSPFRR